MRTRARIDQNQPAIVETFRAHGCDVLHTHQLGKGAPDVFVGWNGLWLACEIKTPAGRLTKAQERLYGTLRTRPRIVRSVEEADAAVGVLKGWHRAIVSRGA